MVLDTSEIKAPVIGEEKRQRVVGKFRFAKLPKSRGGWRPDP
jgi:hypothetical protein